MIPLDYDSGYRGARDIGLIFLCFGLATGFRRGRGISAAYWKSDVGKAAIATNKLSEETVRSLGQKQIAFYSLREGLGAAMIGGMVGGGIAAVVGGRQVEKKREEAAKAKEEVTMPPP